jgi:hypothetical protein
VIRQQGNIGLTRPPPSLIQNGSQDLYSAYCWLSIFMTIPFLIHIQPGIISQDSDNENLHEEPPFLLRFESVKSTLIILLTTETQAHLTEDVVQTFRSVKRAQRLRYQISVGVSEGSPSLLPSQHAYYMTTYGW